MNPFHFYTGTPSPDEEGCRSLLIPTGLENKLALFNYFQKALPLPDYFGHNWDAFEECLTDLTEKISLHHLNLPLASHPSDQKIYVEILAQVATSSPLMKVLFPKATQSRIAGLLK